MALEWRSTATFTQYNSKYYLHAPTCSHCHEYVISRASSSGSNDDDPSIATYPLSRPMVSWLPPRMIAIRSEYTVVTVILCVTFLFGSLDLKTVTVNVMLASPAGEEEIVESLSKNCEEAEEDTITVPVKKVTSKNSHAISA